MALLVWNPDDRRYRSTPDQGHSRLESHEKNKAAQISSQNKKKVFGIPNKTELITNFVRYTKQNYTFGEFYLVYQTKGPAKIDRPTWIQ